MGHDGSGDGVRAGATRIDVEARELDARTIEHRLLRDGRPLTFAEVLDGWCNDAGVRAATLATIAASPFTGVFWEVAPIARSQLEFPYRQVVAAAPRLGLVLPEPDAFARHFGADDVVAFDNLGGDARLVVPTRRGDDSIYGHLAATLRGAPRDQLDRLMRRVGEEARARLATREPIWISTSGLGVAWLHVRIDDRPKYYTHAPYREAP